MIEAPSRKVSPTRLSNTISSSSSPTRAPGSALAGEEHAVEPAIGNRAAVDDRHALGAFAGGQRVLQPVPREARTEIREIVGGIAARQHVEHALEDRRLSSANGAARRTRLEQRRRRPTSSIATIATICCASTSSGLRG